MAKSKTAARRLALAADTAEFLAQVESWASGQAVRFAPVVDELIRWSEENGLEFARHVGVHHLVKFRLPGAKSAFWSVSPRRDDGAKLTLHHDPRYPDPLWSAARDELARIDGIPKPEGLPEVALAMLIWAPYRARVLELMSRLLVGARVPQEVGSV